MTPRDRDAFATIRGFVYQVDLTIERWLTLASDDALELERGEDIDLIAGALRLPMEERDRVLEQVKHREEGLTLRSSSAIEALASAVELRAANPDLKLRFRYTTNAPVALEKPTPLARKTPAIVCWMQCRDGVFTAPERTEVLEAIYRLLSQATKPSKLAEETWRRFQQEFIAFEESRLLALVNTFEWSPGAPPADSFADRLVGHLIESRCAPDANTARAVYERLFLFVFKLLTQRGPKRLTADLLREQLALPRLSREDDALRCGLVAHLVALDDRVSALEAQGGAQAVALAQLRNQVEVLVRDHDIVAALDLRVRPTLNPPALPRLVARREGLVRRVVDALREHRWLAIHGGVRIGKTTLATLVAKAFGGHAVWLRLRGSSALDAARRVDEALELLAGEAPPPYALEDWYLGLARMFTARGVSLVVLDGAPNLRTDDELVSRLAWLADAALGGPRLLSTCERPVGEEIARLFGPGDVCNLHCPPFNDSDASEFLRLIGAPDGVLPDADLQVLNNRSSGHPVVLSLHGLRLRANGWKVEGALRRRKDLDSVLGFEADLAARIQESIPADDDREFLYRLCLVDGAFSEREAEALATASPTLSHARERLVRLLGGWIQERGDGRFVASPLLSELPPAQLSTGTAVACHRVLADLILHQESASLAEFTAAIDHLVLGNEPIRAAATLVFVLDGVKQEPSHVPVDKVLDFWWASPLPKEVPAELCLMLRAQQVIVGRRHGRDVSGLLDELDALIQTHGQIEPRVRASIAFSLSLDCSRADFGNAIRFASHALDLAPAGLGSFRSEGSGYAVDVDTVVWHAGAAVRAPHELSRWTDLLARVPHALRSRVTEDPERLVLVSGMANRLWMRESAQPPEQRRWTEVRDATVNLAARARELGIETLWAAATGAAMVIIAEYQHEVDRAVNLGREALLDARGDQARYILYDAVGRQQFYVGRLEGAADDLLLAVSFLEATSASGGLQSLIYASAAVAKADLPTSLALVERAVRLAADRRVPATESVAACGELMVARWLAGDPKRAYEAAGNAVATLIANQDLTVDQWKRVAHQLAQAVIYIVTALTERPASVPAGTLPACPVRGDFLYSHAIPPDHDYEVLLAGLELHMTRLARATCDAAGVRKWGFAGLERSRRTSFALMTAALAIEVLPVLLADGRLLDALGVVDENADAMVSIGEGTVGARLGKAEYVLRAAVMPASFALAAEAVERPLSAAVMAEHFVRVCCPMFSDDPSWRSATDALSAVYLTAESSRDLIDRGSRDARAGEDIAHVISYIGASLRLDVTPELAVRLQLSTVPATWQGSRAVPGNREPIMAFLDVYWRNALRRSMHRFAQPRVAERSLELALKRPIGSRAQAVLGTVAEALRVTATGEAAAWLAGERPAP